MVGLRYTPPVAPTSKQSKSSSSRPSKGGSASKKSKGSSSKATTHRAPAYLNDRWTLELEELGYHREAEELAHMLLLCEPPFATCLHAGSGAGKTSVMRYAMNLLGGGSERYQMLYRADDIRDDDHGGADQATAIRERGAALLQQHGVVALAADQEANPLAERARHRVATVWFNPWRYRDEPNPVVPLLVALQEQLAAWGRSTRWATATARAHFESGLQVLAHLAELARAGSERQPPTVGALDGGVMRVVGALDRAQNSKLDQSSGAERFRLLFTHAIESVLGIVDAKSKRKGKADVEYASADAHRLVVFIDDLERCRGGAIQHLLQAIELYLATRYTVFVIGADLPTLQAGLAPHAPGGLPTGARTYLDRVFQSRLRLPTSGRFPLFIHNRLAAWRLIDSKPLAPSAYRGPDDAHAVARLLADILPGNPRTVKAFLNSLRLSWSVATARSQQLKPADLAPFALVHRLRTTAPRVFDLACQDSEYHLRVLQDFFEHCKSRTPYRSDPAHAAACAILVDAFRPIVNLATNADRRGRGPDEDAPTAALAHTSVDAMNADRAFARRWRDQGMDATAFRRYAGLEGPR